MPNWCECDLQISGKASELRKLIMHVTTLENEYAGAEDTIFDFNKIFPKPPELQRTIELYYKAYAAQEKAVEDAKAANLPPPKQSEELEALGRSCNLYDWNCNNWGTKWNATHGVLDDDDELLVIAEDDADSETTITYHFDTAWAPPVPVIQKLGELFPTLDITLTYFECGMAFHGIVEISNGEEVRNQAADYFGNRGG